MIGGYPAGLRQRRAPNAAADALREAQARQAAAAAPLRQQQQQEPPRPGPPPFQAPQQAHQQQQPPFVWKVSHVYCLVSALLAVMAIITSASPGNAFSSRSGSKFLDAATASSSSSSSSSVEVPGDTTSSSDAEILATNPISSSYMMDALDTDWWRHAMDFLFASGASSSPGIEQEVQKPSQPWWRALFPGPKPPQEPLPQPPEETAAWWQPWLDPSLLHPKASTLTDLIDKVLTSTPRLLAIANLLLALTYQMHTAVADWFLGVGVYPPPGDWAMNGRERLGSFLVFKLLLISAVVTPDTLDLLILLSWYTLLSFLRSLAHLAAATTSHTTQSGQAPRSGVLQLLLLVLLCDFVAAAVCVALFQLAGVGMVILLTCDCALLAVEVLGHILKHVRQVLEDMHEKTIAGMEEQQMQIHTRQRRIEEQHQRQQHDTDNDDDNVPASAPAASLDGLEMDDLSFGDGYDDDDEDDDGGIHTLDRNNPHLLQENSRRLDQAMDSLEMAHGRRLAVLDTTIFALQLVVHALTVGHFLHIWTLHGIQFTLIDGVLALHLHSALSAASKQIAERRNLHRIARNLDGMFPNATELDLKKALAAGDVCCICLGAMSAGSVKKVGCGHLYHTNCLREVVERAHSMEAAKCPLCRASVVDGSHPGNTMANETGQAARGGADGANNNTGNGNGPNGNNADNGNDMDGRPTEGMNHRGAGERALFRFSTEGILPTWMPLPAFSFEVVRRPTRQDAPAPPVNNSNAAEQGGRGVRNNGVNRQRPQQSLLRRLLLLAGAVPMSPEEEARALASLVDMFPQYDRADLLRELRHRGSAEAVVESVLLGAFTGRARGSAGNAPTNDNNNNNDTREHEAEVQGSAEAEASATTQETDSLHQEQVEPMRI